MQHAGTEYLGELEDELQTVLDAIPVENRLRGLPAEDRLRGLTPEELARGLSEEQAASAVPLTTHLFSLDAALR